jgi:hypothetical protein
MNKYQYRHKMAAYLLIVTSTAFINSNGSAKTVTPLTHPATSIDRVSTAIKHKVLKEKSKPVMQEAVDVTFETQNAIVALGHKDTKRAVTILQGVSSKLDALLVKNPGMALIPAGVETDIYDFEGDNKAIANATDQARDLLRNGKLQSARQILTEMASEIRITTTSIPIGTYPGVIKQVIPFIEAGKIDQATVDLNNVLNTLVDTTEVIPLPVLRAEELLTVAADLEHRDNLSKETNRIEVQKFTDAAKDQLERARLLGYGNKSDYKTLYQAIDGIHKVLFTEKSIPAWQKVKDELAQLKDRLKALEEAVERIGHPAK